MGVRTSVPVAKRSFDFCFQSSHSAKSIDPVSAGLVPGDNFQSGIDVLNHVLLLE
jgi:hypothetical protein